LGYILAYFSQTHQVTIPKTFAAEKCHEICPCSSSLSVHRVGDDVVGDDVVDVAAATSASSA
jgi:hypothetical protein